ncbi:type 1 glutamine amidotransferase domain-containing protein [Myxococcus landrumensis]|uniref:Type 1 glutamine amidotransferase domain-containing protein n=1 Tax=Myxococcus landrumensis TaxID=2813577 RepID=A0ABX7NDR1_9BACT|nr:type 1 glutamine amidotransferase domain-containing protein [Myxococcus landrumus]QSQ16949.1 type 1 glutamine amidotransferase domain-containing protein [Myxococcus landrumus]
MDAPDSPWSVTCRFRLMPPWWWLSLALLGLAGAWGCATPPARRVVFPSTPLSATEVRAPGTVLMVLSAASEQRLADGSARPTGVFLNEFYEPYRALIDAGYEVVLATPGGQAPKFDPEGLKPSYWEEHPEALAEAQALVARLPTPLSLAEVRPRAETFQALLIPGGQGVMVDLLGDAELHGLLVDFGATSRPVGLVCHAPALLARLSAEANPFSGRRVTSVSGFEEWYIETFVMGARAQVRGIGSRLEDAGFHHETAFPGRSRAVRDCNLVTSQNPFSGTDFNALFLAALTDWRNAGRCEQDARASAAAP